MRTHNGKRTVLALLASALTLLPAAAWAQAAPTPAAADRSTTEEKKLVEDKDLVVLSPFRVSTDKDKGYKATNATSGTRLDAPIKDVPLSLEVVTNDFMRDTGATNLRDALRYSSGIILSSQNDALVDMTQLDGLNSGSAGANDTRGATKNQNQTTQKIRGFVVDQVLRDGFRRQMAADWINIDRVEVVRGPSSLLYGVGSFGGVINYQTKRPQQIEHVYFGATAGDNGLRRGEFDFTGPLGDNSWKAAYRLTGAVQSNGDDTDFYHNKQSFISPVFSFRPFKDTEVLIDTEIGYQEERGIGFQTVRGSGGSAAQMRSSLLNAVPGTNPRTFRWSGPDTFRKTPSANAIIDVTQKINDDLYIKAGVDFSKVTHTNRNINTTSPTTSGITSFPITDPNSFDSLGNYRGNRLFGFWSNNSTTASFQQALGIAVQPTVYNQAVIAYDWINSQNVESREQMRVEANYKFDWFGKHNFLVGVQQQFMLRNDRSFGPAGAAASYTGNQNVGWSFHNPSDRGYYYYGVQGDGVPDPAQILLNTERRQNWDLGYYAVYSGKFWKDRITLIGGYRWDRLDYTDVQYDAYNKLTTDLSRGAMKKDPPSKYSPQVGLDVAITKSLSVFGLYSTGLIPNYSQPDGNGQTQMITAKNKEFGLKFDLFDGRVSGTVSRYTILRKNTPYMVWWSPAPYKAVGSPIDTSKPMATVWQWMGPEPVWYAIRSTPNGLNIAKQIFPKGYWATLDNLAQIAPQSSTGQSQYYPNYNDALWNANPASAGGNLAASNWWSWSWTAQTQGGYVPTATTSYGANLPIYFPLVNLSDANINTFCMNAFKWAGSDYSGNTWPGQFYGWNNSTPLAYGNGTFGVQNIPGWNGANVPIDDRADGWDTQIVVTPTDNLQLILSYAHVKRKITTKYYKYVDIFKATGFNYQFGMWDYPQNSWGTMNGGSVASAYSNVNDSSTSIVPIALSGQSLDDTPQDQASLWIKYSFKNVEALKGWSVGLGGQYSGKRQWYSGFNTDGTSITTTTPAGVSTLVQFWTRPQYTYNALVEYRTKLANKYNMRIALNVDNVLDNQKAYGLVYASARSSKLSVGFDY